MPERGAGILREYASVRKIGISFFPVRSTLGLDLAHTFHDGDVQRTVLDCGVDFGDQSPDRSAIGSVSHVRRYSPRGLGRGDLERHAQGEADEFVHAR